MSCKGTKTMSSRSIMTKSHCGLTAFPQKAHSVYGGGLGGSTRISCTSRTGAYGRGFGRACGVGGASGFSGGSSFDGVYGGGYAGGIFSGGDIQLNEKATLQNLNDRLASYLDKVRSLEAANANLERQIREYYEKKGPVVQRDYSPYWNTIKDLKDKINNTTTHNANILLQIDNSKLAADDFRVKYEHEVVMRQCVESDVANLRRLLDQTNMAKCDLEMQIKGLEEELAFMKKNHEEELCALRAQLTGTVNVEVDAAPQEDLNKVLQEIRAHYENIIQKHRREQEAWFNEKMAELNKEMAQSTQDIETSRSQITQLKNTLQSLEIELQSILSMIAALQNSLAETEARYSSMLACYQNQINMLEAELAQLRASIEQQGRDYAVLLDIKTRLEQEIATYRCLLENEGVKGQFQAGISSGSQSFSGSHIVASGGSQSSGGSLVVTSGGSQASGGSFTSTTGVSFKLESQVDLSHSVDPTLSHLVDLSPLVDPLLSHLVDLKPLVVPSPAQLVEQQPKSSKPPRLHSVLTKVTPCRFVRQTGAYGRGFGRACGVGGASGFSGGSSFGGVYGGGYAGGIFSGGDIQLNEKATLQNLNDRLASYLDKVRSLEAANANLERQIREYYEKKGPVVQRDYSPYWNTIKDLKDKINNTTTHNANILLQIDNSKLAADDFRVKYEHEVVMRQCVESDVANLRRLLDQTNMAKCDLEMQIKGLEEELAFMKKNHEEELCALRAQLTGTVNVEVDAAPQEDLNKVLQEIRAHYENIIQKHRREQEAWFNEKMAGLNKEMAQSTQDIETSRSQITQLKNTLQSLEIELQSILSMIAALQNSLAETEARYSSMLACYQNQINMLEAELAQLRASIEQQGRDYAVLLDIKTRLEQEIATYRCLLENEGVKGQFQAGISSGSQSFSGSHIVTSGGSQSSGGSLVVTSGGSQASGGSFTSTTGGAAAQIKQTTPTPQRTY
ncbi:type I cytoskeletal 19-like protein [Labeo rohita]|uniref:Type I cytoskeletal 19-like protein n=1 Tax=Labeo rohita TaxID=84645 RepID=A0A498L5I9_LABRO|nr:type I cytoskeletal 19-like protein [Labeo rohita]